MNSDKIILESCGSRLCLKAKKDLLEEIISKDFVYEHIPSVSFEENKKYDALLQINEGDFKLLFNYPNFDYSNVKVSYKDVVAFAGYILERCRQENGLYSVHANSVAINGEGVVIFGPPYSGKTSVSLNLAQNYNGILISNERTIIDPNELKIVGKTKIVKLNKYVKELINIKDSYFNIKNTKPVNLNLLVNTFIDKTRDTLKVEVYDVDSAEWALTREMDQHIRGISRRVRKYTSKWYRLPSLDTEKLANQRMEDVLKMLKNIPCLSLVGPLPKISDYIIKILNEVD